MPVIRVTVTSMYLKMPLEVTFVTEGTGSSPMAARGGGGFQVLRTNHTSFTVSNLDRTCDFFVNALGFEVVKRAPRDPPLIRQITGVADANIEVAYIQGPGHRLELIQYLTPAVRKRIKAQPCNTGFAHLAFDVTDEDAAIAA